MSVTIVGASPDQLEWLGKSIVDGASSIEGLRHGLHYGLLQTSWTGTSGDEFRAEWDIVHHPGLASAARTLIDLGTGVLAQASRQREASSAEAALSVAPTGPSSGPAQEDPNELRDQWLAVAAARSGINLADWDTSLGAEALRDIIFAVYTYYGDLYLQNPAFQWAGMANIVGPAFAAGFLDLDNMSNIVDEIGQFHPFLEIPGGLAESEFEFYETIFLDMQKEIFFDQAMMHEAYLAEGMDGINDLMTAGYIDQAAVDAWQQIDDGSQILAQDPNSDLGWELVGDGNQALLWREQNLIQDSYDEMRDRPVTGETFTYAMTVIGDPMVPNALSFAEWDPYTIEETAPGSINLPPQLPDMDLGVRIVTPYPNGNLADLDYRWALLDDNTVPVYQDFVRNHPDEAAALIGQSVSDRVDQSRLSIVEVYEKLTDFDGELMIFEDPYR